MAPHNQRRVLALAAIKTFFFNHDEGRKFFLAFTNGGSSSSSSGTVGSFLESLSLRYCYYIYIYVIRDFCSIVAERWYAASFRRRSQPRLSSESWRRRRRRKRRWIDGGSSVVKHVRSNCYLLGRRNDNSFCRIQLDTSILRTRIN